MTDPGPSWRLGVFLLEHATAKPGSRSALGVPHDVAWYAQEMRLLLLLSAVNGFLAVALGAFGAHGLKKRFAELPDQLQRLSWWETASQYQMAHALAIAVCALLLSQFSSSLATWAGYFFAAGILLFCGSLYLMSLTGVRGLGAVTPLGGVCFLVGWGALVVLAARAGT